MIDYDAHNAQDVSANGSQQVMLSNGANAETAAPPAGNREQRRLPKRVETLALEGAYEGFHVTAWINYPGRLREDMRSGDEAKVSGALKQIVLDHDLVDFDGKPYPPASDEAFWTEAPDDLGFAIIGAIRAQFGKLPKANAGR